MDRKLNILITGAGSSMAQSILKALMISCYKEDVRVVFTNSEPMGAGFFMHPIVKEGYLVPVAKDKHYIQTMIDICKKEKIDILFSGTEHEIVALAGAKERFQKEAGTLVMLSDLDVIKIGTDKLETARFFEKHHLPFPKTVLFNDYAEIVKESGYPLFMKPRTASASRNIYKIEEKQQLYQYQFDAPENILIQKYLPGEEEYTVEVFVDNNGMVAGSIVMKRQLSYGLSYWGEVVENKEIQNVCEKIAQFLKPTAAINVQLKVVGGKPIPFEINTRFSSTECIRAHFGFNGIEAAIKNYYFKENISFSPVKEEGYFFRYWEECYISKDKLKELRDKR